MICNICLTSQIIEKCQICSCQVCKNCLEKLLNYNYKLCPICLQYDWLVKQDNLQIIEDKLEKRYQQVVDYQFNQSMIYILNQFLLMIYVYIFYLLIVQFIIF